MNKKSGSFTVINGVADSNTPQKQARVARPLATGLTAFFSITLGISVGLMVPTGVSYVSAAAVAAPSISQAVYSPSFNVNQTTAVESAPATF